MSGSTRPNDNQASNGGILTCPRCGTRNPPRTVICWMCSHEFVDKATRDMIYKEAKKEAEIYRKNTPLRLRWADLMEYYRSMGVSRMYLAVEGFFWLFIFIVIVFGLLYWLLQVL